MRGSRQMRYTTRSVIWVDGPYWSSGWSRHGTGDPVLPEKCDDDSAQVPRQERPGAEHCVVQMRAHCQHSRAAGRDPASTYPVALLAGADAAAR
jgi:hypothetical protein